MSTQWDNDEVVKRFREYLRIKTVLPDVNFTESVDFLKKQASYVGLLEPAIYEAVKGKPVVVFTLEGTSPDLPSILLLISHMVVPPADEQHWDYPPFEAHITKDGWIYGRGSQGAKSVGLMYLEAVKNLKETGYKPKRTVNICFSPDADSTRAFVETQEFRDINVGFALYEGIPSEDIRTLNASYPERSLIKVTCEGRSEHVPSILTKTAEEKITFMIEKFMDLRKEEIAKLEKGAKSDDIKVINMMKLAGGDVNAVNRFITPDKLLAYFHISVSSKEELDEFDIMVKYWCEQAGDGVTAKNILDEQETHIDNNVWCKFYDALKLAVRSRGLNLMSRPYPETTVSRFLRLNDIPVIGFTPLLDTPVLLNDNNERVHVDRYKQGIKIMQTVIEYIAKV